MNRVLRPGGLLLAGHIAGASGRSAPSSGPPRSSACRCRASTTLRRPLRHVRAEGLGITRRERFKLGLIERLAVRKPNPA